MYFNYGEERRNFSKVVLENYSKLELQIIESAIKVLEVSRIVTKNKKKTYC